MTTFETRAMLPTNLRPIEYAKSIQKKMNETWFYQMITRTPVTTGTVRTNISTALATTPLVRGENTFTTVALSAVVVGGTYTILTMGNSTQANYVTAGATAPAVTALTIGVSYIVTALGTTTNAQWQTAGASGTVAIGTIFTAIAQGVGTGTVLQRTFKATAIGNSTGTMSLDEPANPVFSQTELDLLTYQTSIIVSNELFDDTSNLMEFVTTALAEAMMESIANKTLLSVRDNVGAGRLTNGTAYTASPTELMNLSLVLSANLVPAFPYEQRRRACFIMHPSILRNTLAIESLAGSSPINVAGICFKSGSDTQPDSIWGRNVYTSNAMRTANSGVLAGVTGAHILLVDLSQIILYEQPLLVTVDRQTLLGNNQSVIYATQRAVGALMNTEAIVSMNLKPA
jgi:Phage capsid family